MLVAAQCAAFRLGASLRLTPLPIIRLSARNTVIVKRVFKPPLVTVPGKKYKNKL
jgi:hypothetical protein